MHTILDLVNRLRGRIQFHTGLQEGSGNMLTNSDPTLLSNLFLEYPSIDFDLFHISYPFQRRAGSLAKNFPNVFLDMCWSHIISPSASQQTLYEWLDVVPYSKISAFGGDYRIIDAVYGHAEMAKHNVANTLATKVDNGIFGMEEAKVIAKSLFYDNPKRILFPHS
jgi:predicted TIM-barrel fold metal-dependent hydrolase